MKPNNCDDELKAEMETTNPLTDAVETITLKLSDEIRLRRFTEKVLDSRQQEVELLESDKKALAKQVASLKKQVAETKARLSDVEDDLQAKASQLQAARDQVFRLQPPRRDITESEAAEAYQKLRGNVQRWVENRLRGILDEIDGGRWRSQPSLSQSGRFISLAREAARRCVNVDRSDEYHVIAIIMQYLWLVLFAKSFYCPLDDTEGDATLSWIDDMVKAMASQPRDLAHCREWRSETLATLTKQAAFQARRIKYLDLVAEDLSSLLMVVVPHATAAELTTSVRRTIVEPAADLAHQLHLAADFYTLRWPARSPWTRLEVFTCIDVSSGGTVVGLKGAGQDAVPCRQVSYLFDVAPGLFIERVEGSKKASLRAVSRPTVLVHTNEEEITQTATVVRWLWEYCSSSAREGPDSAATSQRSNLQPSQNRRKRP